MAWSDPQSPLSYLISPTPSVIVLTLILVFSIPLLLHLVIYRSTTSTSLPSFLLLGPSGSGKTSLLTLVYHFPQTLAIRLLTEYSLQFEQGHPVATRTSQAPQIVEVSLPINTTTASSRYRSANDPSVKVHKKFLLIDTPGHGKLRYYATDSITKPQNLKGIIFLVDAANLSGSTGGQVDGGLRETAEYLHDILLLLQQRTTSSKTSKAPKEMPVLIAANKLDLFTALPAQLVKTSLEAEISNVRSSRAKGLLDSGIGMNDTSPGEEKDWLGDGGEGKFEFSQMEEVNVPVSIVGGNVLSVDGANVQSWWDWIGNRL
ncbi:hypothetical protein MMC20_000158 [Loxospora ochrophaea]|nr:hypothetical protein [Loxospora ochrophaea]